MSIALREQYNVKYVKYLTRPHTVLKADVLPAFAKRKNQDKTVYKERSKKD
jgi:hypothetical protein